MPFSFPASPTVGQTSTQNGRQYVYAGNNTWELVAASGGGGGSSSLVTAASVSAFPGTGSAANLYITTEDQRLWRWDATASIYVESGPIGGGFAFASVPASATASGTTGQIATDGSHWYYCSAPNTWTRTPLSSWETDPSFASVSLLLNMEGSGSTFVDSSSSPKTITAYHGATQSTSVYKFGAKSLYLNGTTFGSAPYLSVPYSSAFDLSTGDWTVECWAYPTTLNGTPNMFAINNASGQFAQASVIVNTNGSAFVLSQGTNGEWLDTTLTSTGVFQSNTWHHVAYVRSGSTFRLYVNGTSVYSFTSSSTLNNGSGISTIGTRVGVGSEGAGSSTWQGYIDEFRVTKVARYSGSTITVPTAAFLTE